MIYPTTLFASAALLSAAACCPMMMIAHQGHTQGRGAGHDHQQHGQDEARQHDHAPAGGQQGQEALSINLYTLDTCPVSGMKLGAMGEPVVKEYDGREVRFCCAGCIAPFEKEQGRFIEAINARVIEDQLPLYPLDTCVVSGRALGSMGGAVNHVHGNRLVRFCCAGCIAPFEQDAVQRLATLDRAVIEKQKAGYKLGNTCVVSGEPLDAMGEPVDRVVAGRLVRFCCAGCLEDFRKRPAEYLGALEKGEAIGDGAGAHDHAGHQR